MLVVVARPAVQLIQAQVIHMHLPNTPLPLLRSPASAAAYSVKTILQSIQSLLADPNVDSPLNTHAAKLWGVNDEEYRVLVQRAYNGPKAA